MCLVKVVLGLHLYIFFETIPNYSNPTHNRLSYHVVHFLLPSRETLVEFYIQNCTA